MSKKYLAHLKGPKLEGERPPVYFPTHVNYVDGLDDKLEEFKEEMTQEDIIKALDYTPPRQDTTYNNATTSADGLMSKSDKQKLNGVADNANNYILPAASATQLGGVKTGDNIKNTNGTISVEEASNSTKGVMKAYETTGENIDGAMTQKAVTEAINNSKIYYAECKTAASELTKVATCDDFVLKNGALIIVHFENAII